MFQDTVTSACMGARSDCPTILRLVYIDTLLDREAIGPMCHLSAPPPCTTRAPSWLLWQAGSSLHQQSSYYQRAARSRSHRQGDTHSRFHWLVLKLPLRLITNPHNHSLIVEDLFRLRNRPVTSGRLVFIAALSAQRTSLSLEASRLLKV